MQTILRARKEKKRRKEKRLLLRIQQVYSNQTLRYILFFGHCLVSINSDHQRMIWIEKYEK